MKDIDCNPVPFVLSPGRHPQSNRSPLDGYHCRLILPDSEFHVSGIIENCTLSGLTWFCHSTSVRLIYPWFGVYRFALFHRWVVFHL